MDIQTIKQKSTPFFQEYKVQKAALFGSVARQDNKSSSDIDILVEMPPKSSLFDFYALQYDLEQVFQKKVDLVEYSAIRSRLKPYILKDELTLYSV
jgi:uncharacterized protein